MADNLAFDITAKTQSARDELQLLNAQIRATTSEVKKLATEANKDPLAIPKFRAANLELSKLKVTATDLNKTLHHTKEESEGLFESISHAAHGNRGVARLVREFGTLNGSIENTSIIFGRLVGGFAGGVAVGAAIKGFDFLRDTVNEVSKSLGELRAEAGQLNIKPIQLQGAQRAVGAIGEEADIATKALEGMNAQFEELRKNPARASGVGGGSAFGVQVSAGGQLPSSDFGNPLAMLGVAGQVRAITTSRTSNLEKQLITLRAFVAQARNFDPTALNIISKTLFSGVPANSMLRAAPALLKEWQKEIDDLKESSAGATDAAEKDDLRLRASKDALGNSIGEWASRVANWLRPAQTAFNNLFAEGLKNVPGDFEKILDAVTDKWRSFWKNTGQISASADIAPAVPSTTLPEVQAGGALPPAYYGPGRGEDSGHGPPSGDTGTAGHGPGSRATQSLTPGTSDYQGAMANVISPLSSFSDEVVAASKASESAADKIAALASSADAASKSVDAWVNRAATMESLTSTGFARGGLVSGPGSGTSDSILARLSAGEFVVNSASVRRLGTSFLSGLNGYAAGGLVGIPRFAAGGLVPSAAGGRAVHLHLGSGSFALSGSESVVGALVSEAGRQQMRSAGVKPSWFGGRAGGH